MRALWFLAALAVPAVAGEADAPAISDSIRDRHLPHGAILDPVFESPESNQIVSYSRCGDSAIWTGHWLAAESYRYAVTGSPDALDNVRIAIEGIRKLMAVTGTGLLARCAFPIESPYAPDMMSEERHHGVYRGRVDDQQWFWIGNTSRDQYLGVFFGLTVAYNVVDDPAIKGSVNYLATTMLHYLRSRAWTVVMPNGGVSTTFLHRPDQRLAILKLGRRANPSKFAWDYKFESTLLAPHTMLPIAVDAIDDHHSYFKFNLNHIAFYCLLTGGDSWWVKSHYEAAFAVLRHATGDHGNAFFNLIERAVSDTTDPDRDTATLRMLEGWLTRPRRDEWVDLRGEYMACVFEDRACDPISISQRVRTDFLWQRSPFLLYGGGENRIESAGIDYILPYWMARYLRVNPE